MASWIKALDVAALPAPDRRRVETGGVAVLRVNAGDGIRAFGADCPHAGAPLEEGALCEGRIVFPWHKGAVSIESVAWLNPVISGRAGDDRFGILCTEAGRLQAALACGCDHAGQAAVKPSPREKP